jgi:DNA-binding MarR family transcriptional regulator
MQTNIRTSLGYALVRAFREVNRASSRALAAYGLSAEQAHILVALWTEGPMKVGELQRLLSLGSGTLTGALDRMDKAKLVRRVPDPTDGRVFRVEPVAFTPAQRRAIQRTLEAMEEDVLSTLTERERRELLRMLEAVERGAQTR